MAELFDRLPFENLYWNQAETLTQEECRTLQTRQLRRTVERVRELPLYRSFFEENPLQDEDFQAPEDVRRLPFTTLTDLRAQFPNAHWTVPRHEIARVQTQDGFLTAFTRHDLQIQADLSARYLYAVGIRSNQMVQVSHAFGRAGLAFALQSGIDCIGTASIPAVNQIVPTNSAMITGYRTGQTANEKMEETIDALCALNADAICADAEFVLAILTLAQKLERNLPIRNVCVPATSTGIALRYPIQKDFPVKVWLHWEHPAFFGAGLAGECCRQDGLHIQEDRFLFECIHPETLQPLPDGEPGELVVTDLAHEAQSLLRFRTGIIGVFNATPCPCGRTTRRVQILGENDA